MKCDLIIKNGYVVDPANEYSGVHDVYVNKGIVIDNIEPTRADKIYDATGLYVFPGLIDYHAHVFPHATEIGIETDVNFFPQGITTVVDAGSAGVSTIRSFVENIVQRSEMDVYGLLNVCPTGLGTMKFHEDVNPIYWDEERMKEFFSTYHRVLKGLKIRISKNIVKELGLQPFKRAIELAERLQVPLVVHTTDAPASAAEIASLLRPGDTFAHCFHGTGNTIIGKDGKVLPEVRKAQANGVLMDAANGGNHWSFAVAEAALADGFMPDIISTDLTIKTLYSDPVFSLPYIMSKYLALGLKIEEIVRCCTSAPAQALGLVGAQGSLAVGNSADISVMRLEEKQIIFSDTQHQTRQGHRVFIPQITIHRGRTVYRNIQSL